MQTLVNTHNQCRLRNHNKRTSTIRASRQQENAAQHSRVALLSSQWPCKSANGAKQQHFLKKKLCLTTLSMWQELIKLSTHIGMRTLERRPVRGRVWGPITVWPHHRCYGFNNAILTKMPLWGVGVRKGMREPSAPEMQLLVSLQLFQNKKLTEFVFCMWVSFCFIRKFFWMDFFFFLDFTYKGYMLFVFLCLAYFT